MAMGRDILARLMSSGGVRDNAASGYVDVGNVRIQWGSSSGTVAGSHTITLPAPFKDANYSVDTNIFTAGLSTTQWDIQLSNRTTTAFTVMKTFQQGSASTVSAASENFCWTAIGMKP